MSDQIDVVVIGAGPAGYVAAIRAAQLGLTTVCIDDWKGPDGQPALGGTCLNVGCIPSKALLESSELFERSHGELAAHGLVTGEVKLDLEKMMSRKDGIVSALNRGVSSLLKANGVTMICGRARLGAARKVEILGADGSLEQTIHARHVILATGSSSTELTVAPCDGDRIVDSSGALSFSEVPGRLGVIGAGVIGLELGSVWRRLGSEVTLIEAMDTFLPMADRQIASSGYKECCSQGLDIKLGARVTETRLEGKEVVVTYQDGEGTVEYRCDRLIVAVGREPNSAGVLGKDSGVSVGARGFIIVDESCRTNIPGVYAIGDLVRGPMLAHKGSEEGAMVAEIISGRHGHLDYLTIPSVIYTHPEIAWVGRTEESLMELGIEYRTGTFPFAASGRAMAMGDTRGMIKVLADAVTDRVLGVHMIGPHCSELIAEAVIVMQYQGSSEDLAMTVFAHPSLSESLHEAAMDVNGYSIHKVARRER